MVCMDPPDDKVFATITQLLSCKASLESRNLLGETPLLIAMRAAMDSEHGGTSEGPWLRPVRALLERNADVNAVDSLSGETPLIEAACRGDAAVCKLLLEYRADPRCQSKAGLTALTFAEGGGYSAVARILLAAESPPESEPETAPEGRQDAASEVPPEAVPEPAEETHPAKATAAPEAVPEAVPEKPSPEKPEKAPEHAPVSSPAVELPGAERLTHATISALREECKRAGLDAAWCIDEACVNVLLEQACGWEKAPTRELKKECAALRIPIDDLSEKSEIKGRLCQVAAWKCLSDMDFARFCQRYGVSLPSSRNKRREELVTMLVGRVFGKLAPEAAPAAPAGTAPSTPISASTKEAGVPTMPAHTQEKTVPSTTSASARQVKEAPIKTFIVTHSMIFVRDEPTAGSKRAGLLQEGHIVRGQLTESGNWLRLDGESMELASGGSISLLTNQVGYAPVDGKQHGIGASLMEPYGGPMPNIANQEFRGRPLTANPPKAKAPEEKPKAKASATSPGPATTAAPESNSKEGASSGQSKGKANTAKPKYKSKSTAASGHSGANAKSSKTTSQSTNRDYGRGAVVSDDDGPPGMYMGTKEDWRRLGPRTRKMFKQFPNYSGEMPPPEAEEEWNDTDFHNFFFSSGFIRPKKKAKPKIPKIVMDGHYKTLGVPPDTKPDEVRKAYRRLALKHHPDKNPNCKDHSTFYKITEAYETICQQLEDSCKGASSAKVGSDQANRRSEAKGAAGPRRSSKSQGPML
eukprot:gnl/TRDRNA2_/TRDRNA2_173774_c1_seq2.p1 gnl/TRDRNA2_/TRDRNA2_173774_c1~~gnl/TRDRNA2_/TRDRNA2_173774_c1_seq2.p1  ORF type:complete len:861 (+),score=194.83 gnl/TRDRNA2_/TRDRNA2_173774_c1_seq2:323-2584(+)